MKIGTAGWFEALLGSMGPMGGQTKEQVVERMNLLGWDAAEIYTFAERYVQLDNPDEEEDEITLQPPEPYLAAGIEIGIRAERARRLQEAVDGTA